MAQLPALFFCQPSRTVPQSFSPSSTTCPPLLSSSSPLYCLSRRRAYDGDRCHLRVKMAAGSGSVAPTIPEISGDLKGIYECCSSWRWNGFNVNFLAKGRGPPLLLVHGFGASVFHWRRNIGILSETHTVYAIDLLGFGSSDKPLGFSYTMEVWAELILDFLGQIIKKPTVLIGNSVGSLACVIAATYEVSQNLIRGLVLLNCAGGMNNKAILDDWRIRLILPLLWFFDILLKQRVIASVIFENVKKRENLQNILLSVYGNKESVDEDLIEIITRPADDVGALDAFVSIVTGPAGPSPVFLMPKVIVPVLVLWGDEDPFTPIDGPIGKYFSSLPSQLPNVHIDILPGVGHCPHDDRPELVHEKLLPWLAALPSIEKEN